MQIRYSSVLTNNEIFLYAQMVDLFRKDEIDFITLKKMFLNYGITMEPVLENISQRKMPLSEAKSMKERLEKQEYFYSEIRHFILNSEDFKNVYFCIDYDAIEILADHGIPEYQEAMVSILTTRLKNSSDSNEELRSRRSMWKRKIKELEVGLEKSKTYLK